jgi:hypothetical protein
MVFVAGMQILGPLLKVRRNSFIVMLSLAFGLGVAMEPQVVQGNGASSFYGKNVDFNHGLWPGYMTCEIFPTINKIVEPEKCTVGMGSVVLSKPDCAIVGGTYKAAKTEEVEVKTCVNANGKCCLKYNAGAKAIRLSILLLLKTPYGIAVLIAALLNLILPTEKDEDIMEDGTEPAPKAASTTIEIGSA